MSNPLKEIYSGLNQNILHFLSQSKCNKKIGRKLEISKEIRILNFEYLD